jgi:hypothetical protein
VIAFCDPEDGMRPKVIPFNGNIVYKNCNNFIIAEYGIWLRFMDLM